MCIFKSPYIYIYTSNFDTLCLFKVNLVLIVEVVRIDKYAIEHDKIMW
jgi:hypothetical protein